METALLSVQDDIFTAMEKGEVTALTLDLSAAFDTIDHQILLNRLTEWFLPSTSFLISPNFFH